MENLSNKKLAEIFCEAFFIYKKNLLLKTSRTYFTFKIKRLFWSTSRED
jgi:hypothetical protein